MYTCGICYDEYEYEHEQLLMMDDITVHVDCHIDTCNGADCNICKCLNDETNE